VLILALALSLHDPAALAAAAVLFLAVLAAVVALARRGRRKAAPPAPAKPAERELPPAQQRPPAAPPPRPAEPVAAKPAPPAPQLSKDELEAHRKEEYRRKKEEDRLEKERRRQEREEADRRAAEEAARLEREAAEARQRVEEERQRRIQAEAGRTLAAGLEKTRGGFMARLNSLFTGGKVVDDRVLADLEEVLFTADIGVKTATQLLEAARERVRKNELSDPARLRAVLREDIERILAVRGKDRDGAGGVAGAGLAIGPERPFVVMIVGVNGSGKTTTVGKLAAQVKAAGHTVLLGAGDTFRAAAGEQLEIWAERVGAPIVRGKEGSDPASVCFDAVKQGVESKADVVLCDTAGRLHTKAPLMEELKKVMRVIGKACPGAPHEVLLVLDATNGQNAIAQARQFHEALGVTGIALTKLDGTAKGGVIIGVCDELKLPVRYVGVGEQVADLRPFVPHEFVEALFEETHA
jgi:fused signal recognition particle receptor